MIHADLQQPNKKYLQTSPKLNLNKHLSIYLFYISITQLL